MILPSRIMPGQGQESVWDYPRPPRAEPTARHLEVVFAGTIIADSRRAVRVLETSHPPTYYIPAEDVRLAYLVESGRASYCEWKGEARYFDVIVGERRAPLAAWTYRAPSHGFGMIAGHFAFYVAPMEECRVDGERARPQPGSFYGGWVTSGVVGPFKGEPGSAGW
jgi:uncharacterized protein (DUF427 family)